MDVGDIAIVVIGRNEGDRFARCLASLGELTKATVYVDSGSTDNSVARAQAAGATVVALDVTMPFTAARARNAGLAAIAATGSHPAFIQFVDGDCEVDSTWLATAAAFLAGHPHVVAVCGRRRERDPDASIYNRLCDREWDTPIGEAQACGGDALFRSAPLIASGGFDPALMAGEEPELCARLRAAGGQIWRIDAEMTRHDAAMLRFGQWWRREVRSGYGFAHAWQATRALPHPLYRREIGRALFWALAIPLVALAAAMITPWALAVAAAIYALQIVRIAMKNGADRFAWCYALLMLAAKFAEVRGMAAFAFTRAPRSAIDYK